VRGSGTRCLGGTLRTAQGRSHVVTDRQTGKEESVTGIWLFAFSCVLCFAGYVFMPSGPRWRRFVAALLFALAGIVLK
jgi:hypothetical protein